MNVFGRSRKQKAFLRGRGWMCLVLVIFLAFPPPVWSSSSELFAEYLVKLGESYLEKGDTFAANHQFTKALMIDPSNKEAQYYLNVLETHHAAFTDEKDIFQVARLSEDVDRYRSEIIQLVEANKRRTEQYRKLKAVNESLKAAILDQKKENKTLFRAVHRAEGKVSELAARIEGVEKKFAASDAQKDEEIAYLRSQVQELNDQAREKIALIEQKDRQLKKLEAQIQESNRRLAQTQAQWEQRKQAYAAEIAALKDRYAALQEEKEFLRQLARTKREENDRFKHTMYSFQKETNEKVARYRSRIVELQMKVTEQNSEIAGLQKDLYALNDQRKSQEILLRQKEAEWARLKEKDEKGRIGWTEEKTHLREEIARLKDHNNELRRRESDLQKTVSERKKTQDRLEKELARLQTEFERRQPNWEKQLREARAAAEAKTKELAALEKRARQLESTIRQTQSQWNTKDRQVRKLQEQLAQATQHGTANLGQWERQKALYVKQIKKLEKELAMLSGVEKDLKEVILAKERENARLRSQVNEAQRMARTAEEKARKMEKVVKSKTLEITRLRTEIEQLNDLSRKRLALIREKDEQLKDLEKRFERARADWEKNRMALELQSESWREKFIRFQKQSDQMLAEKDRVADRLKDALRQSKIELGYLNNKLLSAGYKLGLSDDQIEGRDKKIFSLTQALVKAEKKIDILKKKNNLSDEDWQSLLLSLNDETEKVTIIKRQDEMIAHLKRKLAAARREVTQMQSELGADIRAKVAELKEELAELKKQLARQEKAAPLEIGLNYDLLDQQIKDTQARLDLVESILAEYDSAHK